MSAIHEALQGNDKPGGQNDCDSTRGLALLALLLFLLLPLSAQAEEKPRAGTWDPPSKPLSTEEARKIARKVLNPDVPKHFKKAPNLWEIYLRDDTGKNKPPSYYLGVEFPKGMKEAYYYPVEKNYSAKPEDFSLEELAVIDPTSTPQPLLHEEDWTIYKPGKITDDSYLEIVNEVRKGNPYAAKEMAFGRDSLFWQRVANALSRLGWGNANIETTKITYRLYGDADLKEQIPSLAQRLSLSGSAANMSLIGRRLINKGNKNGLLWLQESARRGEPISWIVLVHYYAGVREGLSEIRDSRLAYALALKCSELPISEDRPEADMHYIGQCMEAVTIFEADESEMSEEDLEYGYAIYEQIDLEYEAYQRKMLEDQRAWRKGNLPEVNRQLDAWQAEVENNHPGYFERDHKEKQRRRQSK